MELDKRIKPNKMPLTCFDINKAKQFIGKNCYFSRLMSYFENLNNCTKAPLEHIDDNPTPFNHNYCFVLPCEWVDDPNDVENLKSTIAELRKKIAEQEKIIAQLNGIETRKENTKEDCDGQKAYEREVADFMKRLDKWMEENLGD